MNQDDLQSSTELIIRDFRLEPEALTVRDGEASYSALIERLVKVVDHLISTDFNKLLNILYRIDVSEEKLKDALSNNTENTSEIIAQMIFERELQKVETRKKYS